MRVANLNVKTLILVDFQQLNVSQHKILYTQINIVITTNTSGKWMIREDLNRTYRKIINFV